MSGLIVIEIPMAPNQQNRFVTCHSGSFQDMHDLQFCPLSKVIVGTRPNFKAKHNVDFGKRVVDFVREQVRLGDPRSWLGSIRVSSYVPLTGEFTPVYTGVQAPTVAPDENVPKVHIAQDGTWRKFDVEKFEKASRGWRYPYLVAYQGIPQGGFITGATKGDIVEDLFGNYGLHIAIVSTFPLADPADVPAPPEPVVERVYTQAELAAVPPMPWEEYVRIPTAEEARRKIMDPLFAECVRKTCEIQAAKEAAVNLKIRQDAEAERVSKQKEKYLKEDEDRLRKGDIPL